MLTLGNDSDTSDVTTVSEATNPTPVSAKRPYLRQEDRRHQLLEVAEIIVEREGLARLNMSVLAKEAGVTRQTVYHHFSDINELIEQVLIRRFGATLENINQIATTSQHNFTHVVTMASRVAFTMKRQDRDLMRYVFFGLSGDRPELHELVTRLREILIDRWVGFLYGQGEVPLHTRPRIWAALSSLFGLWDLVDDSLIDVETAVNVLIEVAMRLPHPES